MTLEQLVGACAYDTTVIVFLHGCRFSRSECEDKGLMCMPVLKIESGPDGILAYISSEKEKDDYDLTPTRENMKAILDEAFGNWYVSKRDELAKEIVNSGEYDDEVIERFLSDTEYESIDEMTEKIDELKDEVENMRSAFEDIYHASKEFVDY